MSLLETPHLMIDEKQMLSNIAKMAAIAGKQQVKLRPHIKTHKMPEFAHMQIKHGAVGITVAKLAEAEIMAEHGIDDIFIAYPLVVPSKIERFLALSKRIRLIGAFDSLVGVKKISELAVRKGMTAELRMEVDLGLKRTGVVYDKALELAKAAYALPGIKLNGIYGFKGPTYQGKPTKDIEAAGKEEAALLSDLARAMEAEGMEIEDISAGSSPSAGFAGQDRVTEIRPGTYIFNDRMQEAHGVCSLEECAAHVTVTIVSRPTDTLAIVDGGSKTFASDVQPGSAPLHLDGFGQIKGYPDAVLERMNEEHGMLRLKPEHPFQIGDQVEIIPNHICSTVNLHNYAYLKQVNGEVAAMKIAARGQLT